MAFDIQFKLIYQGIRDVFRVRSLSKESPVIMKFFSVHAFRDTFASRAIRAGVPPNTLKEILGHASLSMTMDLYAHVSQSDKRQAMEMLQDVSF